MAHFYQLSFDEIICLDTGILYVHTVDRVLVGTGKEISHTINYGHINLWQRLIDLCEISEKRLKYESVPAQVITNTGFDNIPFIKTGE